MRADQELLEVSLRDRRKAASRIPLLTGRQREVLLWLASGHSNDEIAHGLFITRRTVKAHVTELMTRLGAMNRLELAVIAVLNHIEKTVPEDSGPDIRAVM